MSASIIDDMNSHVSVVELTDDQWQRYRDIRLASLEHDGAAFGGNLESEREFTESQWRQKALTYVALVAVVNDRDIGVMTVENLKGDFGATCWIGGCWVHPDYRKIGALRSLFAYADTHAAARQWSVQGLGVWIDNYAAIAAYEKLGFVKKGDPQNSTRKPGLFYQRMIRQAAS